MSNIKFHIVQVAHRDQNSIKASLASLSRQTHKSWSLTFIDDASTDQTAAEFQKYANMYGLSERVKMREFPERKGFAASAWVSMNVVKTQLDDSATQHVVLLMKGSHRFSQDRALEKLAKAFSEGWAVVWSKWRDSEGSVNESGALHPYEDVRQQPWVFCGPLAFDAKYIGALNAKDLQFAETNHFFMDGGLQAFGYALCESTIKRRYLREILFTYDEVCPSPFDTNGLWRDELMGKELRLAIDHLADRDSRELRVDQRFFQEHIYEFTEMAFVGERYMTRREFALRSLSGNGAKGLGPMEESLVKDLKFDSSIASSLIADDEAIEGLSDSEKEATLLRMDIEDAEMMAEAGFEEESLKVFEELLQFDPDNARIHTNIGVLHWNSENTQEGMKHFLLAIRNDRDNHDPVLNCAGAWVELGRLDQAKAICANFLERFPEDRPVKELLTELQTLG